MIETAQKTERAVLIGIIHPWQDDREVDDYLNELSFLAETAYADFDMIFMSAEGFRQAIREAIQNSKRYIN